MKRGPAEPHDANWPKLLSLAAHEFRSPLTVVAGYIRMLLKDRAGPISDQQRRLLEEAEKSCARLSQLVAELSALSQLESGTAPFNRSTVNLTSILSEVVAAQPELPDRGVTVTVAADEALPLQGDAVQLKTSLSSILHALRREVVTGDELVIRVEPSEDDGGHFLRMAIGEPHRVEALLRLDPSELVTFDEWRGGNGLSLPSARRILEAHGARIWSPPHTGPSDHKASAIIVFAR